MAKKPAKTPREKAREEAQFATRNIRAQVRAIEAAVSVLKNGLNELEKKVAELAFQEVKIERENTP